VSQVWLAIREHAPGHLHLPLAGCLDFLILLQHPELRDPEVAKKLSRSAQAICVVRSFVHSHHTRGNISGLSQMILRRLQKGGWICPICEKVFPPGADPRGSYTSRELRPPHLILLPDQNHFGQSGTTSLNSS
jgi:hypothetical protein